MGVKQIPDVSLAGLPGEIPMMNFDEQDSFFAIQPKDNFLRNMMAVLGAIVAVLVSSLVYVWS